MDELELKYYIALQPKIREAMGEWKNYDAVYHYRHGYGHIGKVYDPYKVWAAFHIFSTYFDPTDDFNFTRLPLPIDPRNPGRGLWGMVDWSLWKNDIFPDGDLLLQWGGTRVGGTPTLALLKALAAQWNVEVKG